MGERIEMKRFLSFLLILVLAAAPALADPLVLLEDLSEEVSEPYNPDDPSDGVFTYSVRYPRVEQVDEGSTGVNMFYSELFDNETGFTMPMIREAFEGFDSSTVITYTVTCNNDDYFSVLIDRKSTRLNSSHTDSSRMPSSA